VGRDVMAEGIDARSVLPQLSSERLQLSGQQPIEELRRRVFFWGITRGTGTRAGR